ncbi:FixH family protein [Sphingomicrobium arenosum]|uniref:FixH family protein n=1 Tax=Sphingomicrobium arenosum TaxID=2233861 RepID=UPI002240E879|nr:FixH family protein [Sphingomicrobium arenosum]
MKTPFTGRKMALVLVAFFGVVMAVNFTMARLAIGNFGGTVVDNSYVAGQAHDEWAEAQQRQDALGWDAGATWRSDGRVEVRITGPDASGLEGRAEHRLRKSEDVALTFVPLGDNLFLSEQAVGEGRWSVRVTAEGPRGGARFLLPLGA